MHKPVFVIAVIVMQGNKFSVNLKWSEVAALTEHGYNFWINKASLFSVLYKVTELYF